MDILLNGVRNFLELINNNWTTIVVIIGLIIGFIEKVKVHFSKSNTEKVGIAQEQIKNIMLKLVADAEIDYQHWKEAGNIKRSQVIKKIFTDYPILSKITNQEEIVKWLDDMIDESLKTLKGIVDNNIYSNKIDSNKQN